MSKFKSLFKGKPKNVICLGGSIIMGYFTYEIHKEYNNLKQVSNNIQENKIFRYTIDSQNNSDYNLLTIRQFGEKKSATFIILLGGIIGFGLPFTEQLYEYPYYKIYSNMPEIVNIDNAKLILSDNYIQNYQYMTHDKMSEYIKQHHKDINFNSIEIKRNNILSIGTKKINDVYMYGTSKNGKVNVKYISDDPAVLFNQAFSPIHFTTGTISAALLLCSILL